MYYMSASGAKDEAALARVNHEWFPASPEEQQRQIAAVMSLPRGGRRG